MSLTGGTNCVETRARRAANTRRTQWPIFWGGFGHSVVAAAAASGFQTECGSCFCLSRDNHFTLAQDGAGTGSPQSGTKQLLHKEKSNNFTRVFNETLYSSLISSLFAMKSTKTFQISDSGTAAHPSEQSVVSSARKRRGIIYFILPCHDPSVRGFTGTFRNFLQITACG